MGLFRTEKEKLQRALRKAARNHDIDKLRAAVEAGADIHERGEGGWPPLSIAVDYNFKDGVFLLLKHGADPDAASDSGYSCLMLAARDGSFDVAKMLIEGGASLNAKRNDGKTALHVAAENGRGEVVRLLIASGADAKAEDNRMSTPADYADKNHPRLADFIRGKAPAEETPAPAPAPCGSWQLTAPDEVATVEEKPGIGYRITEIFNFGSGIYTRIAQNVKTGAESQSTRFFDEFASRAAIDRAREELVKLGGRAADDAAKLAKPALAAPKGGAL